MLAAVYFQYPTAAPYVAVAWVLLAVAVVILYRRQTRGVAGVWRFVLPSVRLLALTAVALSVLRPVISRRKTVAEQGPVLIVLDSTVTMGVVDNTRPAGQWVAIAAAVGKLPDSIRDSAADTARADCDRLTALADELNRARAALDYARLAGRGQDSAAAALAKAVADLHQAARQTAGRFPAALKSPDLERTLALLINEPARTDRDTWMTQARDRTLRVGTDLESARLVADTRLDQSDPAVHDVVTALSDDTRLQLAALGARRLVARLPPDTAVRVVSVGDSVRVLDPTQPHPLVSTSVQTVCSDLTGELTGDRLPPRAVVLFSDGRRSGSDIRPASPAVAAIPVFTVDVAAQSPPRDVWISSISVPAEVFADRPIPIEAVIQQHGYSHATAGVVVSTNDQPTTQRSVTFADEKPVPVKSDVPPPEPGPTEISVDVPPLDGEASTANNHAERWVKVIARHTKIAVPPADLDPAPDARTPDARAAIAAWSNRPGIDVVRSADADVLAGCDLIVLFDLDPAAWTTAQWQAAKSAVIDRGASIVWVAGDADRSAAIGANPVAEMLIGPAGRQRPAWITRPGGRATYHAVSPGGDDRDALAAFARFLPAPPANGHRTLLVESESGTPVLAVRNVGRGKMFAVTARDFAGNSAKFWNELLKNAVDEPYESSDDSAAIDASAIAIEPGQAVRVRVRLFGPGSALLRVTGSSPVTRDVPPAGDQSPADGRFAFNLADLPPGDQTLQAVVDGKPIGPAIPLHVRPDPAAGLNDLAGDENPLRHLADTSNGHFLRLDQLDTLPKRITDLPADTTHPVEIPLWDTPLLFGLVVGLFVLEWTLRKAAGLV